MEKLEEPVVELQMKLGIMESTLDYYQPYPVELPIPSMLRQDKLGPTPTSSSQNSIIEETPTVSTQSTDADNVDDASDSTRKHWGVLGEWANLTCNSPLVMPVSFEWIHTTPSANETLQERFGIRIINDENFSVLMMIVKTEDMFGQYICETTDIVSGHKKQQKLELLKGKRPSKIQLRPELILMTTASFKVLEKSIEKSDDTEDETKSNNDGDELPFVGFVVWLKPSCHIRGPWVLADITDDVDGFKIHNLHPNEGYYVKAASRNTGAVGEYGEYWKIRTSTAILLKSNVGARSCSQLLHLLIIVVLIHGMSLFYKYNFALC